MIDCIKTVYGNIVDFRQPVPGDYFLTPEFKVKLKTTNKRYGSRFIVNPPENAE